jgi:hypothetical protein
VTSPWVVKRVLLAPAAVRNAAARKAKPEEAWLLRQDAGVRRSYVREVLDKGAGDDVEQAWMLLQPKAVREAYVREVLGL